MSLKMTITDVLPGVPLAAHSAHFKIFNVYSMNPWLYSVQGDGFMEYACYLESLLPQTLPTLKSSMADTSSPSQTA